MRRRSEKQSELLRVYREFRDEWIAHLVATRVDRCWLCGNTRSPIQCEHMAHGRAKSREATISKSTFFAICGDCHHDVIKSTKPYHPIYAVSPAHGSLVVQLTIKAVVDPAHFGRDEVLMLYGYAGSYITSAEIAWTAAAGLPKWIREHINDERERGNRECGNA